MPSLYTCVSCTCVTFQKNGTDILHDIVVVLIGVISQLHKRGKFLKGTRFLFIHCLLLFPLCVVSMFCGVSMRPSGLAIVVLMLK